MNQIGWIDYSREDRNLISKLLASLSEEGALDEIGIGVARDRFSDILFPGITTLQTRAKYFFLVPYTLMKLENQKSQVDTEIFMEKLRREEKKNCKIFGDVEGNIGNSTLNNNFWIKRGPSEIYWTGLKKYGFFNDHGIYDNLSLNDYVKISLSKPNVWEEDSNNRIDNIDFWSLLRNNHQLYPPAEKYYVDLKMSLTAEERKVIKHQIEHHCYGSLLKLLLMNPDIDYKQFLDYNSLFLSFKADDDFGKEFDTLMKQMKMAYLFSELTYFLRILYNCLLNNVDAQDMWNSESEILIQHCKEIDLDDLSKILELNTNTGLYKFIKDVLNNLEKEKQLKILIQDREFNLKRNRSKIGKVSESGWIGGKRLDYRFQNAKHILNDILE